MKKSQSIGRIAPDTVGIAPLAKLLGLDSEIKNHHVFLAKHGWRREDDGFGECWYAPWDGAPWCPESALRWQLQGLASTILEEAGWKVFGTCTKLPDGRWLVWQVSEVLPKGRARRPRSLAAGLRSFLKVSAST